MTVLLALLVLAISVRQDQTPLRNGCDAGAETVASLPAGAEVTIRFVLSGESTPCYKIATMVEREGTDRLRRGKRAPGPGCIRSRFARGRVGRRKPSDERGASGDDCVSSGNSTGKPPALAEQAAGLLESGQPEKALQLIEPAVRRAKDPGLLALAGAAAWRADDSGKALVYWRQSLDLQPIRLSKPYTSVCRRRIPTIRARRACSESASHCVMKPERLESTPRGRWWPCSIRNSREFQPSSGCVAEERIVAIAQSPEAYRKTTDAAEWSGGQFDGRIRVPVGPGQGSIADATIRRTLAHEITHACLTLTGRWPAWLQEGLAQRLSGDIVSPELHAKLAEWSQQGKLPKLANLGQDWSRLDREHAVAAYGLSLEAVETFYASYGATGIRNLLHNPDRLPAMTADLERRLGLSPSAEYVKAK